MPDADVPHQLLEVAARLLAEEGPAALTARRLTGEAGTSTMAVYTHFGGMPALVRAVVADGFAQLRARTAEVPVTDDPVHDLALVGEAYRRQALSHPHLYAVMFGTASLGGYRLEPEEMEVGAEAYGELVRRLQRAIDAGAVATSDARAASAQLWCALHGFISLELSGFISVVDEPEREILEPLLTHVMAALMSDS